MVESSSGAEVKFPEMGAGFPPVISRGIFSGLRHFLGKWLWGGIFTPDFAYILRMFLLTPGFFPVKTKKYLHRHPADS